MPLYRRDGWVTLNAPTYTSLGGVNVYVCNQPSNCNQVNPALTPVPPSPLAAIYSDSAGTPLANPVITDGFGHYFYYAPPSLYDEFVNDPYGRISAPQVYLDQPVGVASGGSGASGVVSVGLALPDWFIISGSPVLVAGTLTGTSASFSQSYFLASPTSRSGPL